MTVIKPILVVTGSTKKSSEYYEIKIWRQGDYRVRSINENTKEDVVMQTYIIANLYNKLEKTISDFCKIQRPGSSYSVNSDIILDIIELWERRKFKNANEILKEYNMTLSEIYELITGDIDFDFSFTLPQKIDADDYYTHFDGISKIRYSYEITNKDEIDKVVNDIFTATIKETAKLITDEHLKKYIKETLSKQ